MNAKVLITGSNGLLANKIKHDLCNSYDVVTLTTRKELVNQSDVFFWDISKGIIDKEALLDCDYIIHLAGYSISNSWTTRNKARMYNSRIEGANLLFDKCVEFNVFPEMFISASAIGYYDTKNCEHIHKEIDVPGNNWVSKMVVDWEKAADQFKQIRCKVTKLRISLLISRKGGILKSLLLPFHFYIGFIFSKGNQDVEWIHINDASRFVIHIIKNHYEFDNSIEGVFNLSANRVTHLEFIKTIQSIFRPNSILINIPSWILKFVFREQSKLFLNGCKVSSEKLNNTDFNIQFNDLHEAIEFELSN